ncbi:MAG: CinA family nicotinamide mononucleotide deamidase-related protein [Gammaproteobacteria bacterium]|nr:CinA family nicotinamide mononucleotide deamidase-related protein [Gammaproteobacteria bacterium]MBA3730987.1 CinA family nicotinamide mononucleotide deamidase-related protein [Gammaproteobacteria bacterium]
MRCEVIAVGSELLLGQHIDTNSAWIGEQLALAGIDSHYHTHVGDNRARIVETLRIALNRNDAVIMCGGLGPTHDDITREAIAEIMGVALARDEAIVERIRERFVARGREMPQNNQRQADVPEGASLIAQMPGTAPGLVCPLRDRVIYAVPGVPYEMREMIAGTVVPDLQKRAGAVAIIKSRTLRTWGQSESGLAELLETRIAALDDTGNPTLALLASGIEGIKVRITARARDEATAQRLLDDEDRNLRAVLGDLVFGIDAQTMEFAVIDLLRAKKLTLAVAETMTGGLMSARLTRTPGVDDILRGSVVAINAEALEHVFGAPTPVDPKAVAGTMAAGACAMFAADAGLAAVCVDEDTEAANAAQNDVVLAVTIQGELETRAIRLPGDRERRRQFAAINLLNFLRLKLAARESSQA